MTQEFRRAIAYVAGRLVTSSSTTCIYDYSLEKPFHFTGEFSKEVIHIYDCEQKCEITGGTNDDILWLRHSEPEEFLSLKRGNDSFKGSDETASNHLSVTIFRDSVHLYDYQSNLYYSFRLLEEAWPDSNPAQS